MAGIRCWPRSASFSGDSVFAPGVSPSQASRGPGPAAHAVPPPARVPRWPHGSAPTALRVFVEPQIRTVGLPGIRYTTGHFLIRHGLTYSNFVERLRPHFAVGRPTPASDICEILLPVGLCLSCGRSTHLHQHEASRDPLVIPAFYSPPRPS